MGEVRIPAQCASAFAGANTLSSIVLHEDGQIISQKDACQPVLSRNFLDHSPDQPKLFIIPSNHKPRAKVVQETDKKLKAAYQKPKSSLKTLQFHDESGHRVKSQRREAAVALLQVMNYYQDDATGRIGRRMDDGTFRDISLKKLAQYAGIQLRRAKRAIRDIVRAGYLKVIRQFLKDPETGEVKGLPSVRSFLPKFFIDLDVKGAIWTKWFAQRGWAKERADKKVSKDEQKKSRAMMGLIKDTLGTMGTKTKGAMNKVLGIVKGVPSVPSQKERIRLAEHKQKIGRKAMELFNLDPSKSIGEYYREVEQAYSLK